MTCNLKMTVRSRDCTRKNVVCIDIPCLQLCLVDKCLCVNSISDLLGRLSIFNSFSSLVLKLVNWVLLSSTVKKDNSLFYFIKMWHSNPVFEELIYSLFTISFFDPNPSCCAKIGNKSALSALIFTKITSLIYVTLQSWTHGEG